MSQKLLAGRDKEREFISQMMDPTKVAKFDIPVAIKADLRKYQQEGVNWLAFLNKYHLHGVLCDDMGLGKTLQTICIVASDHHLRAEEHRKTGSVETRPLPSLVVCPPTLTGHWFHELKTYAPFLKVLVYVGNPTARQALASTFKDYDVVVTSYDIARNDCSIVNSQSWNYCVLDEGHIIKNAASKLTKAVKTFNAEHRVILSGTPIQNNVLELWSLFDFLMPGFLGSEKVFNERFAKPIAASRNSKSSSKEQEAGALALEALHKQVLPFLLRRLKEDVLADLPPKIIQDYYCDLSDLQKQLYETFVKKQRGAVASEVSSQEKEGKQHIFQALQYMRKLCNHPALVLNPQHPQYSAVVQQMQTNRQSIRDIVHAPKLQALQELLIDCGIGAEPSSGQESAGSLVSGVTSQHRALIFCQLKDMLDMVEVDLLKKHMPSVTYMRLDGSVDARKRHDIVQQFNSDPSIDVLLLTTHVGGLGLNLTGADTVIFVEHDWNPMNDLQAMDRAHRIGQKKVVNVYRLITRNTLEEKIMGLQKFKLNIASTIINQQNSGLGSMDTDQILDLFNAPDTGLQDENKKPGVTEGDSSGLDETGNVKIGGQPAAALELGELWDEKEYEEEYNLDSFIRSLKD
jgi:TATA-binding protein-associated factor